MGSLKKLLTILFRIGISIILLFFLFRQVDKKMLWNLLKNTDKPFLFFGFIIFFIPYLLCLFRWQMLLKAANIDLPLKRIIISFAGGIFFNLFLPSTIGGDLVRSIDLAAHTKKPRQVVATVFLDRLSGYIGVALVLSLAVLMGWRFLQDKAVFVSLFIIVAVLVAILLVLFNKFIHSKINRLLYSPDAGKIREAITSLHQEVHYFGRNKKLIFNNLALSFFVQLIAPVTFYFVGLSLGIKINIIYFLIFLPIIGAITLLPVSIGGLGLRDATTIYFFAKAGVTKDLAFAMSLINFSFILAYGALAGIIYVVTVRHRRLQYRNSPS